MTDTELSDARRLADQVGDLARRFKTPSHERGVCNNANQTLRTLTAEVERLQIALEAAGEKENALHSQLEEVRHAPWPEWTTDILKMVREESGYDGYDDAEGVDVAEEVRELIAEFKAQIARLRAAPVIA
jgi:hypothetical protein